MPIVVAIFIIIGTFLAGNSIFNHQVKPTVTEETLMKMLSPSLTPTQIPTTDLDPIINCTSSHPNCLGQSIKGKQSECKNIYCCVYPDKAVLLSDKSQCVSSSNQQAKSNIDCIGPDGKHSQKTQKECDGFNAAWRKPQQANRNNVPNNQSGTVNCKTQSGWVNMTKDDCTKAQNAWGNQILDSAKQQTNQEIINGFRSIENEIWQAKNYDQLDNIRERLRQLPPAPDPSIQNYIGTLIRLIEARIKILQQQ